MVYARGGGRGHGRGHGRGGVSPAHIHRVDQSTKIFMIWLLLSLVTLMVVYIILALRDVEISRTGFWPFVLWMIPADWAFIVAYVNEPTRHHFLTTGVVAIIVMIGLRFWYVYLDAKRILVDVYMILLFPLHLLAWEAARALEKFTHGTKTINISNPWDIAGYVPEEKDDYATLYPGAWIAEQGLKKINPEKFDPQQQSSPAAVSESAPQKSVADYIREKNEKRW